MKKFISLLVAFAMTVNFLCVQVAAEGEVTSGEFTTDGKWEFNNGVLSLGYGGPSTGGTPVAIPNYTPSDGLNPPPWDHLKDQITTVKFTSSHVRVGDYAFYGYKNLTAIVDPHFMADSIGAYAFAGTGLTGEITIGMEQSFSPVKTVGDGAFSDCPNIETVTITTNVKNLGKGVFKNSGVKTADMKVDNQADWAVSESLFEGCGSLSSFTVSSNQKNLKVNLDIKDFAFKDCTSLENIDFLTKSNLIKGATIGNYAFSGSGVANARLPDYVTSMGIGVFENCPNLASAYVPDGVTEISDHMFAGDTALTNIIIGGNITRIGDQAFSGTSLSSITIPYNPANSVTIGEQAFLSCGNLTEVILPPNVTEIGDGAFNSCVNLKSVFIPNGVTLVDGGSNVVSPNTYKITYNPDIANKTAVITAIESGTTASELADIPTYIRLEDGTDTGMLLFVNAVDGLENQAKVSDKHSHIPGTGNMCTICGKLCGNSRGTTWSITTDTGTLIISADETAKNEEYYGRMDNYDPLSNAGDPNYNPRPWDKETKSALEIREGVTYIGNYAFTGMTIPEITFPSSVLTIGQGAFSDVTLSADTTVFIPPTVNAVYDNAFAGSNVSLILYPGDSMFSNLPETATRAKYHVDGNIVYVDKVDKSVPYVPYQYPKTVIVNGVEMRVIARDCEHVFDSDYGKCTICEAVIGGNMGRTGDDPSSPADGGVTWYWSPDDNTVYISVKKGADGSALPAAVKNYDLGDNTNPFIRLKAEENAAVTDLVLESGITEIGSYAFYQLNQITGINIPATVTKIGNSAFEDCRLVTVLTLPNGIQEIGKKAFYNVNFNAGGGRTFIDIPDSIVTIGSEAFVGCTELNYIAYPDKLTATIDAAGIPPQVFKLEYRPYDTDPNKVVVSKILPGNANTLITMPTQICGKDVYAVLGEGDPNDPDNYKPDTYHDLVNKDSCPHNTDPATYIDHDTNKCRICGRILGDASENLDGTVDWLYQDGVLYIEGKGGIGTMKNFSRDNNPPWQQFMAYINKVVLKNIRNIGDYAFSGAYNIKEVEYPESGFESIGQHAFEYCTGYSKIIIPDSVTALGGDVFFNVGRQSAADGFAIGNIPFITLRKDLYENHKNILFTSANTTKAVLLLYEDTADGRLLTGADLIKYVDCKRLERSDLTYPISAGHEHCFNDTEKICILCGTVGGNCGSVDDPAQTKWALDLDTGYISITGNGIVDVNPWLDKDKYTNDITTVFIGKGVTSICDEAFKDCVNLSSVTFEAGSVLDNIGVSAFAGCTSLGGIEFPGSLRTIGDSAFSGSGLKDMVIIPANIVNIGADSFNGTGITALMIPDSYADSYKPGAPVIHLSQNNAAVLVYSDDGSAVLGICVPDGNADVNVNIPSNILGNTSVTRIEGTYKYNVDKISGVTLPETLTSIGSRAFAGFGDYSLNADNSPVRPVSVVIPQGVSSIGESAFEGSAIKTIALPNGVTVIPKNAFYDCRVLETVTVSTRLAEIGETAFGACNKLTTVNTPGVFDPVADFKNTSLSVIGSGAFSGCTSLIKAVLPSGINHDIPANTFDGCTSLAILEIPERYFNNDTGWDISSTIVNHFDVPSNDTTTVIVYREIDNVNQITSAVFGNDDNWQNRITNENDVIDNWLIVWKDHDHCFNKNRECVLCKQQGGKCGETATWVYDKNRYTIIINSNGGDGVMWDMVEGVTDVNSDDYIHYQEMWGTLKGEVREVVINEGMTTIGANAFKNCPELLIAHIPASLTQIGKSAFEFTAPTTGSRSTLQLVYIGDNSNLQIIEENAFKNCAELTNIGEITSAALPENLRYIRTSAFEGCRKLPEVIIPDSVTTIGERAFADCSALANVKLPLHLSNFGREAFLDCVSLKEIVVPPGVSDGQNIFGGCANLTLAVIPNSFAEGNFTNPPSFIKYSLSVTTDIYSDRIINKVIPIPATTVTIPDYIMYAPVRTVDTHAFEANTSYNQGNEPKIILPSTLTAINDMAFEGCTWIKELALPYGLASIGTEAFEGCVGLTGMEIPDSVTVLGKGAFHMCTGLETVKLSNSLRELQAGTYGTFEGCSNLRYIRVPEGVRSIGANSFKDCTNIEYILLPFSMRTGSIDFSAFENCPNLAAIYVPTDKDIDYVNGITDSDAVIGTSDVNANGLRIAVYDQNYNVFKVLDGTAVAGRSTSYETQLNIPEPLSVRENPAHQHCFNIHNQCIICGDRGGQCGPNAWWELDEAGSLRVYPETDSSGRIIESVIDHDSAEYFGTWTEFKDRIYAVTVEEGITLIDSGAFESCLRLQEVHLPDSLEYLQDYAFSDCISLIEIDLPDGIISLGEGVFKDDINLKNVVLPKSISELPKDTFKGCRTLESITLPRDLRYVRDGAFSGCINLKSIELPVDTRTVSEDAFSDCTNLTYIVAPDACRYIFNESEFPNATYFKYAPEGEGVKITYARPGANVHHLIIPDKIAGLTVVAIDDEAFIPRPNGYAMTLADDTREQGLISITIPSSVTVIGNSTFMGRTDIQTVTVEGSSLVKIGNSAFEGCTSLSKANLPSSVQAIGDRAFYGCASLGNIPMYEGLLTIGSRAFANCGFTRAFVIIPGTVTAMGESVFGSVANNALIAIPQKLAKKYPDSHAGNSGSYDFRADNCGYVVYRVDSNGNKWVVEGKLGDGQTTIIGFENYMNVAADHQHCLYKGFCVLCNFAGGTCGTEDDGNGNSNAKWYIDREGSLHIEGQNAMKDFGTDNTAPWREYADTIKNIIVHEGITNVSANAFTDCVNAAAVTLPSTVRSIGENAFRNNESITKITIPEGVTVIPANAFNGCTLLREVDLPESLTRIEAYAFAGCGHIDHIELPAAGHDIYVDNTAFEDTLDYIAMPEGTVITAETVPYNRFTYRAEENGARIVLAQLGTSRGSELEFPAAIGGRLVNAIGGTGYANVVGGNNISDIRMVTIPEGVTEIYSDAFAGCVNLRTLSLPDTLETIGDRAFSGCDSLINLVFKRNLKSIGANAFSDCDGLEIIKLPLDMDNYSIGTGAFSDCDNLDIIVTPRNVIDNRGYTPSASLVYYERRADGRDYIAAAKLGSGKTNINVAKVEALGVYLDIDNHEHCYNEGVCVLCNDDGGLCGVGVTWSVNGDTLEIKLREGLSAQANNITGEMYDFTEINPAPWLAQYKDGIRKLVIREGVISIGSNAFSGLTALSDISEAFPSSVTRIGENAFASCANLIGNERNGDTLVLSDNIRDVAGNAFVGCSSLKRIILSDSSVSALSVTEDTAVIKYSFVSANEAQVTKIELAEGKKTDVPNTILNRVVIGVAKEYRKFVTENHDHYHLNGESRCTICDMISGECGDSTKWYVDEENKRLVIHGEGGIRDFNGNENAPWTQYAELFNDIIIREPVSSIGDHAFVDLGSYDEITLPPSVTGIGEDVFAGTTVRRMYIPSGLNQGDRDKLDGSIEKVYYQVTEDREWVDVTRIDLPAGVSKISIPRTIYHIPVRSVAENYRKFVDQDDGHEHDYGDECGESECRICGKVSYNHVWSDGWNHNGDSHWHDCERGDYDPIRDGYLDGSEYGDHEWKEVERREPTSTEDGYVIYRCEVCGYEKREVIKRPGTTDPDDPTPPDTGTGGFDPPPSTSGGGNTTNPPPSGGDTTNPPGGNGGSGDNGENNGGENTTYIPQPWETTSTELPPVTNPPINNLPDVSDFNGEFSFNIEQGGDSMPAKIMDSTSDIIKAVLSEDEQDKLINGTSEVQIILSVTKGDGTVSLRDRAIISAALGEFKLGEYMDISLYKVVDGVREKITHTSAPLTITVDIPNELRNSGRRFRVIRAHDGSATVLRDLDNAAGTVTISTDRFSPYAIAYTDSVNVSDYYDPPMPTGDPGISAFIFVSMASGLTAVGMIYFNHASDVEVDEERRKKIAKLVAFGKKGKVRKYIAIGLIFLVTLYYQGIEGIQGSKREKSEV